jgi:hypothetical protein
MPSSFDLFSRAKRLRLSAVRSSFSRRLSLAGAGGCALAVSAFARAGEAAATAAASAPAPSDAQRNVVFIAVVAASFVLTLAIPLGWAFASRALRASKQSAEGFDLLAEAASRADEASAALREAQDALDRESARGSSRGRA